MNSSEGTEKVMGNEEYRGLTIDLTNCLQSRNQELAEAKAVIGSLLVTIAVPEIDRQQPINRGREWLKRYNDRMYPKAKSVTSSLEQEEEVTRLNVCKEAPEGFMQDVRDEIE